MGSKVAKKSIKILGLVIMAVLTIINVSFAESVILSWDSPLTNADDTELTDLAGFYVHYGTESQNYSQSIDVGNVTSYQINNLSTGITYYFSARAYDTSGNLSEYSDELTHTIPIPDTTAPVISSVGAGSITVDSAAISWTTDEASDTKVEYGTTTAYGSVTTVDTAMTTGHSQVLSGLEASTEYHYRVISSDAEGNEAVSGDYTFTTLTPPDPIPPVEVSYYCDSDNDGYINSSADGTCEGEGCEPVGCQTIPGNDCNDAEFIINPGAQDSTCDGIDNNCDGTADDEYVISVVSCGTGVCTSVGQIECQSGEEVNTCSPGTPEEETETTCGDGEDNDCDGQIDEGCFPDISLSRVLMSEDFASGIPENWSAQGGWNNDSQCGKDLAYPFEAPYAIADSSCATTERAELVTEVIDSSSCSDLLLSFSNQYYWYTGNVEVAVSSDSGTTWTSSYNADSDDGYPESNWKDIDISYAAGSENGRVRFSYINDSSMGYWALDNVWITCQTDRTEFAGAVNLTDSQTLLISNNGTENLVIDSIIISGIDSSDFSIGANDACSGMTLLPGDTCDIDVEFTADSIGEKQAVLTVNSNDPDMPEMNMILSGTGTEMIEPVPVIKVNGQGDSVSILRGEEFTLSVNIEPGSFRAVEGDVWLLMEYNSRWYYFNAKSGKWRRGYSVYRQSILDDVETEELITISKLNRGQYIFYLGVDTVMNGVNDPESYIYDSVMLNIE